MTRVIHSLRLNFDHAALQEYHEHSADYDLVLSQVFAGLGKRREHGVDLGPVEHGLAWHGNMHYEEGAFRRITVDDSIFLVNLPRAILGHPTVLLHELTHHFHLTLGPERLPCIRAAYLRTQARLGDIRTRFAQELQGCGPQFDVTFRNELEFFAYMHEAYHSKAGRPSPPAICFEAPAFPYTRQDLRRLDADFGLGIAQAIEEAMRCRLDDEAQAQVQAPVPAPARAPAPVPVPLPIRTPAPMPACVPAPALHGPRVAAPSAEPPVATALSPTRTMAAAAQALGPRPSPGRALDQRLTPRPPSPTEKAAAETFRERFEVLMARSPGLDPNAAAAALLQVFSSPSSRSSSPGPGTFSTFSSLDSPTCPLRTFQEGVHSPYKGA